MTKIQHYFSQKTDPVAEAMEDKIAYLQAELMKMRAENVALRSCIKHLQEIQVVECEPQQRGQYAQSDFRVWNSENTTSGFPQTFFNPQMKNNTTTQTPGFHGYNESAFPSTDPTFIEVIIKVSILILILIAGLPARVSRLSEKFF